MSATPLVSVSMVTYNHERFVAQAVRSVLGQSLADLELVVVNDGSTDGTAAALDAISDPRVVVIHQDNQGPGAATNRAIAACRGKYVALFSGDDVCHADRLRCQFDRYQQGQRRVLFSGCDFIDDDGRPITDRHFASGIFEAENRSRAATLARLFHHGNYFNGVTTFTEREVMAAEPYDPALLQLQDFDVWSRHARRYDLEVMSEPLIRYRIRGSGGNLSSPSPATGTRLQNETYLILRRFFDGVSADLFREAFRDELVNADFASDIEFACERAFAYCRLPQPVGRLVGIERLHDLLNRPDGAEVLARRYRFGAREFFDLLRSVDLTTTYVGDYTTLYPDTGNAWTAAEQMTRPVSTAAPEQTIAFQFPDPVAVRMLRWDPVELRTCQVHIRAIDVVGADGQPQSVDLASVASNGVPRPDGAVEFTTADPMFWWPVHATIRGVTVRCRIVVDNPAHSIMLQCQRAHDLAVELANTRLELEALRASRWWRMTAPLRRAAAVLRANKAA